MDKKTAADPIEAALEKIKALQAKRLSASRLSSLEEDRVASIPPFAAVAKAPEKAPAKEKRAVLPGAAAHDLHQRRLLGKDFE